MTSTRFKFPCKYLEEKVIGWAERTLRSRLFILPRRIINEAISYALSINHQQRCNDPERANVMELVRKIKSEVPIAMGDDEAYQLFMAVRRTRNVDGDIAEVGVCWGGSAKLICEAKGDKPLHLFDTFAGLPDLSEMDDPNILFKGQFLADFEHVKNYLKGYPNVQFYKGIFPLTAEPIEGRVFSLVNVDVDLYESTLSCLKFFYPRMNKGGIIISHDYLEYQGVKKAVDDFFEGKQETIIELYGGQCLIVKL